MTFFANPEAPTASEMADLCDGARDQLLVNGWAQLGYGGGMCIGQALAAASGLKGVYARTGWPQYAGDHLLCPAGQMLRDKAIEVADHKFFEMHGLFMWNDVARTTEDDVHDLLLNVSKSFREDAAAETAAA